MAKRQIVHIDEQKCDGCGLCVPSCEEGAIQIVAGKARLVADVYCDGLGACLGHCPQGAISIIEREADEFDQQQVEQHLAANQTPRHACPGAAAQSLHRPSIPRADTQERIGPACSGLANWPVQLHLVPPHAPYLHHADVLLVADCVPFACADFHQRFLDGRPVVIGCPKLDDVSAYVEKLVQMIQVSNLQSLNVLHMEVPCCTGLLRLAETAVERSGRNIPVRSVVISRHGEVLEQPASPSLVGLQIG